MMNRSVFDLIDEVNGETYVQLLHHALSACQSFSLVIRQTIDVKATAQTVLNRLDGFLIRQEECREWPGTKLLDGTAEVYTFQLLSSSASVLADVADGLFSWTQPELPEDLCLIRRDGEPWLVTIAHEEDGYLVLSPEERIALRHDIPTLYLAPQHEIDHQLE
jgi:hypothetical protein